MYVCLPAPALLGRASLIIVTLGGQAVCPQGPMRPFFEQNVCKQKIHIVEPELESIVRQAVEGGFLKATLAPEPADAFLIAVPTPFLPTKIEDSIPKPDLSFIKSAANLISKVLKKGDLVILESTSPVGTTEQMSAWLAEVLLQTRNREIYTTAAPASFLWPESF